LKEPHQTERPQPSDSPPLARRRESMPRPDNRIRQWSVGSVRCGDVVESLVCSKFRSAYRHPGRAELPALVASPTSHVRRHPLLVLVGAESPKDAPSGEAGRPKEGPRFGARAEQGRAPPGQDATAKGPRQPPRRALDVGIAAASGYRLLCNLVQRTATDPWPMSAASADQIDAPATHHESVRSALRPV
jgi:hypothetical protein